MKCFWIFGHRWDRWAPLTSLGFSQRRKCAKCGMTKLRHNA